MKERLMLFHFRAVTAVQLTVSLLLLKLAFMCDGWGDELNRQDINHWFEFYYQSPRPELTTDILRAMHKIDYLAHTDNTAPLIGFFSQIFAKNPEDIKIWLVEVSQFSPQEIRVFLLALHHAPLSDNSMLILPLALRADMADISNNISEFKIEPNMQITLNTVSKLQLVWGAFLASGDLGYLRLLLSVTLTPENNDNASMAIRRIAKWLLRSNLVKPPKIAQFLGDEAKSATIDIPKF